ncbi:MAG TPA: hypothetical protein DDZ76_13865 [Xanthomonadales bacterium]|nr:hypothetical protein [Xanthomonadales bacterium]
MSHYERRSPSLQTTGEMRASLSPVQIRILGELERHGWELGFVRRSRLNSPLMFVYDAQTERFEAFDGEGRASPPTTLHIRH